MSWGLDGIPNDSQTMKWDRVKKKGDEEAGQMFGSGCINRDLFWAGECMDRPFARSLSLLHCYSQFLRHHVMYVVREQLGAVDICAFLWFSLPRGPNLLLEIRSPNEFVHLPLRPLP